MRERKKNRLIISIDLDMWWHCRWATGSQGSLWPNTKSLFEDYYGSSKPGHEIIAYTEQVLALLDEFGIKSTFFVLGEMASYFPNLIRRIHGCGHEIACHGWYHVDANELGRKTFRDQVDRAKKLPEDLTGEAVLGYRAPNLVLTPWLFQEICDHGFVYDSSICPSRKFFGKYQGFSDASNNPFCIPVTIRQDQEQKLLVEIPIPAMPVVRLPACSGIISRVCGCWWTQVAIAFALKGGDVMYYFHPYEIGDRPKLKNERFYIKVFFRNVGISYKKMLRRIFKKAQIQGTLLAREAAEAVLRGQSKT